MLLDLVFIRHGMTAGNQERRYIGQNDDQPLSEHGRRMLIARQADGLYPRVQARLYQPAVPLPRDSAAIVSRAGSGHSSGTHRTGFRQL